MAVILGFQVNFIKDTMEIFYNGQRLDVSWKNIPKGFTIVMCSSCSDQKDNFSNARKNNAVHIIITALQDIFEWN